jgi:hypothetical protein
MRAADAVGAGADALQLLKHALALVTAILVDRHRDSSSLGSGDSKAIAASFTTRVGGRLAENLDFFDLMPSFEDRLVLAVDALLQ